MRYRARASATSIPMAAVFCMTAVASVGAYRSLFVLPESFSSPPASPLAIALGS